MPPSPLPSGRRAGIDGLTDEAADRGLAGLRALLTVPGPREVAMEASF